MRDSRGGAQQLVSILEDVTAAVERLWDMVPLSEGEDAEDDANHVH